MTLKPRLGYIRVKVSVSRDILPLFFHYSNPSGPLTKSWTVFLNSFSISLRYFNFYKYFVVCIPIRSQTQRCASYRKVRLHGVHHTEEWKAPKCIKYSVVCFILQTAESRKHNVSKNSVLCIIPRSFTIVISLWCLNKLIWKL